MTATPDKTSSASVTRRLFAGVLIGAVAGVLVDVLGVRGLLLLLSVIAVSALVPPRFALLAGVLIAAGSLWLFFSLQAVIVCSLNPSSCSGPRPEPFAGVAGIALAAGIVALQWTRQRRKPSSVIRER